MLISYYMRIGDKSSVFINKYRGTIIISNTFCRSL